MTMHDSGHGHDDAGAKAAVTREAKGSVQEAIGKLIGDDAARAAGTAERKAGAGDAPDHDPPTGGATPRR
jgi:uncharacterized protein YjbJ (UPF0337 family)